MHERKPLDATAYALTIAISLLWGGQQVIIKATAPEISLLMQGALRFIAATLLLLLWARWRRIPLFQRDGTLASGLLVGLLFSLNFVFMYAGLANTTASRNSVFVYMAPVFAAVGLHLFVPGERLGTRQWLGVLLAFTGVVVAFSEGFFAEAGASTLRGDVFAVIAGFFWAATTVILRATRLAGAAPTKTVFYQMGIAALVLPVASRLMGEAGVVSLSAFALASLFYQTVLAGFVGLLAWFWLLRRYLAARIGVLSFLTPIFGVAAGAIVLSEPLTGRFIFAAVLVAGGIVLVNRGR